MSTRPSNPAQGETQLRVRRGRVDSVDLYEIKDSELDLLEKGSPAGLELNFAIFLLSVAFSAIATLSTATFKSQRIEMSFMFISVVGIVLGAYLLLSWLRTRSTVNELCKEIRSRIPPDVLPPSPSESPAEKSDHERPSG
jgi:hypothetical protein